MTTGKQIEALKLALEALEHEAETGNDDAYRRERDAIREALAEQPAQQEPVAWVCYGATVNHHDIDFDQNEIDAIPLGTMLYTSPQPSKPWVGLSTIELDEIDAPIRERGHATIAEIYRAIEAKLREKNA